MTIKHQSTDHDTIESEIFSNLRKIIKAVDIYSSKLRESSGISSSQLSCLLTLDSTGPISLSTLSNKVSLSPSMITSVVDQLEGKQMVERKRHSSDRRVILIELTEKGKKTLKSAPVSFQKFLMNGLSTLTQNEKLELNKNISKLLSIIATEVIIDSSILGVEDKLVGVDASVLESEKDMIGESA